ncbi:hypothetical protein ACP275_07G087800 [Erythranthe tilingii]
MESKKDLGDFDLQSDESSKELPIHSAGEVTGKSKAPEEENMNADPQGVSPLPVVVWPPPQWVFLSPEAIGKYECRSQSSDIIMASVTGLSPSPFHISSSSVSSSCSH